MMAREVLLEPMPRTTALVLDVMAANGLDAIIGDMKNLVSVTS